MLVEDVMARPTKHRQILIELCTAPLVRAVVYVKISCRIAYLASVRRRMERRRSPRLPRALNHAGLRVAKVVTSRMDK